MSKLLQLALAGSLVLAGLPASGQDNNNEEPVDNIVVSASRAPSPQVSVGSATTVITREQIELRQSRYVTDLLRSVPGFAVSQVGARGSQTQVRVRGAEANHVLVLIDGVRANDPASGDEFRWETLSTSNVERIEIVRGPQSSLWGSDALAGVPKYRRLVGECVCIGVICVHLAFFEQKKLQRRRCEKENTKIKSLR